MNNKERIYLSPPHMSGCELQYIQEAFDTNWIAPLGPHVSAFEEEICAYTGAGAAVALSSGTAAIHLALRLLGIGPGDVVFCSTLTFIGSVNPVLYQGAEPIFIDSEPDSWNMSAVALQKAFDWAVKEGKLPKAVIIVNIYGQSADMDPLISICSQYGVPVIEDAAESLGATYKGKASGTFGKFGIYSFNGNKIITTSGGGMLISDDLEAIDKALFLATQAKNPAPWYQHSEIGYNYRMSNIVAAIGRGQLKFLDERVLARRAIFFRYFESLKDIELIGFMPEAWFGRCNRWLTVITINPNLSPVSPTQLIDVLQSYNIEARPVWKPMHLQPIFKGCKYFFHKENSSLSDVFFTTGICLPSGSNLSLQHQERVISAIRDVLLFNP